MTWAASEVKQKFAFFHSSINIFMHLNYCIMSYWWHNIIFVKFNTILNCVKLKTNVQGIILLLKKIQNEKMWVGIGQCAL